MAWARLDDGFHDHPKVDGLSLSAVGLYTLCLTWAHRHRRTALLPGHVTEARVRKLAGKQAHTLVTELLAAGLWEPEDGLGGWVIHDFADYLPKERDPDERREAGRKGAAKRWQRDSKPDSKLPPDGMATDSSRASAPASPTRPVPVGETHQGGERRETSAAPAATQPSQDQPSDARCSAHRSIADPGPCKGCQAARERAERLADRAADQAAREREERIRNCPTCEGTHFVLDADKHPTGRKCDHRRIA